MTRDEIAAEIIQLTDQVNAARERLADLRPQLKELDKAATKRRMRDTRSRYSERNRSIYDARKDGDTLEKIGVDHGISRERVRQICWKMKWLEEREAKRSSAVEVVDSYVRPDLVLSDD